MQREKPRQKQTLLTAGVASVTTFVTVTACVTKASKHQGHFRGQYRMYGISQVI